MKFRAYWRQKKMLNIHKMYEILWLETGWPIGWGRGYASWLFMLGQLSSSDGLNITAAAYYSFTCQILGNDATWIHFCKLSSILRIPCKRKWGGGRGGGGVRRFWDKDTYTCIGRIIEDQNIQILPNTCTSKSLHLRRNLLFYKLSQVTLDI